jgi:ketosteroid isomerase-like protein
MGAATVWHGFHQQHREGKQAMSTNEVTTSQQRNKETVRRLFAAFTANDAGTMDQLLAPGFTAHGLPPELGTGAAAMKGSAAVMHTALHDCRCEIENLIAENDLVAARYTARATHNGELFGAPPSGRTVTITGIEIYRLAGGRIAEYWGEANMSELFTPDCEQAHTSAVPS